MSEKLEALFRLPVHRQPVTDVLLFWLAKHSKLSTDEDMFKYSNKNAFPFVWPLSDLFFFLK